MKYRLAIEADRQAIARIHIASWQENYQATLSTDFLNNRVGDLIPIS